MTSPSLMSGRVSDRVGELEIFQRALFRESVVLRRRGSGIFTVEKDMID